MRFPRKQRRSSPSINIIPLIDVLVVLLIFYIATTVFKKSEPKLKIVVPDSTTAKASPDSNLPSTIYVTTDSKLYLDDVPVDPDKLGALLKSKMDANPAFKVAMRADTKAPFGMITKVMDAAHFAGIKDLPTYTTAPQGGSGAGDSAP